MSLTASGSKSRMVVRVPQQRGARARPRHQHVSPHLHLIPWLALGVDLCAIAGAIAGAEIGRFSLGVFAPSTTDFLPRITVAAPLIVVGWVVAIAALGGYQRSAFGAGTDEFRRIVNSALAAAALTGITCYLLRTHLARGFFVLSVGFGLLLLLLGRLALRTGIKALRRRGRLLHRVLIVGAVAHVDEVASVLNRESWLGYDVIGALTPSGSLERPADGVPVLGDTSRVADAARAARADVVFLAGGAVESAKALRHIAWDLEHTSTQLVVAPSLTDVSRERIRIGPVGGLGLLHLKKPQHGGTAARAKRAFDVVGAASLLVAFSPVLLLASVQLWRRHRSPVLVAGQRIGRNGQPFTRWRLRAEPNPRSQQWRLRVSKLPELVNVLRGEMSLVGPRPQMPHEVAPYDDAVRRRLQARPGMTGLWQVSGREDLSLEEAIRLDLYYVDNWSMVQDLSILGRTFRAMFRSRDAC